MWIFRHQNLGPKCFGKVTRLCLVKNHDRVIVKTHDLDLISSVLAALFRNPASSGVSAPVKLQIDSKLHPNASTILLQFKLPEIDIKI